MTPLFLVSFHHFTNLLSVKPLLKKSILDPNDMKSYRRYNLFSGFQSAYSLGHSTETVLLKVVHDLLSAWDESKFSVVDLLDMFAAFDTVNHDILPHCLHHVFGMHESDLSWFKSHLTNIFQMVSMQETISDPVELCCGVSHGSVLGPPLLLYIQSHSCHS